jgi:hypothetical protein
MLKVGSLILLLALNLSLVVGARPSATTDEERAQEILKQARAPVSGATPQYRQFKLCGSKDNTGAFLVKENCPVIGK